MLFRNHEKMPIRCFWNQYSAIRQVSPNTLYYLYSDGIIDQVGGEKRRGFGRKRLLRLLSELQHRPMAEQMTEIQHAMAEFQGDEIRRDDVTVVGFRL